MLTVFDAANPSCGLAALIKSYIIFFYHISPLIYLHASTVISVYERFIAERF